MILEYLLCAKNRPSCQGYDDGQNQPGFCVHRACPAGETHQPCKYYIIKLDVLRGESKGARRYTPRGFSVEGQGNVPSERDV